MTEPITIECSVHFQRGGRGSRKQLRDGEPQAWAERAGRVPRAARLMALAIRFDQLVRDGVVADYAELARLGHVTRARMTQIMNLTLLAPDIQEQILHLPPIERGHDHLHLRDLQSIAAVSDWRNQRRLWADVTTSTAGETDLADL